MKASIYIPIFMLAITWIVGTFLRADSSDAERTSLAFKAILNEHGPIQPCHKDVAIGYNTNVDLIVDGIGLIERLKMDIDEPRDRSVITSIEELGQSFLYYFEKGSAAERTITNADACKQIIDEAQKLDSM